MSHGIGTTPFDIARMRRAQIRERNMLRPRPSYREGDMVRTTYVPGGSKCPRRVTAVYPADTHCQTGWQADTIDPDGHPLTGLDSAWYEPLPRQDLLPL